MTGLSSSAPEALLGPAVLDAAEAAGIGVTISQLKETDGRHIYISDAAVRMLGGTREELMTINVLARIAPEERAKADEYLAKRGRGEIIPTIERTVLLRPDGTRLAVRTRAHTFSMENEAVSVVFIWDLSELEHAEERARMEHERLRRLIETAPDAVVVNALDEDRVLFANSAAVEMFGEPRPEDVIGKPMGPRLLPDETRVMRQRMAAIARGETLAPFEYKLRRPDGTVRIGEVRSTPFEFAGQHVNLAFVRDVTERARLEEQLHRSQRLASLGTLAAGVAHEINNPLAACSLSLELLGRRLESLNLSRAERTDLEHIRSEMRQGMERIARIVRDLSSFSRVSDDALGPIDIDQVLRAAEYVAGHAFNKNTLLSHELAGLPPVLGVAARLEQVFVNLLVNAAQAVSPNPAGEVHVRGRVDDGGEVVIIEVQDNGPGIPPEVLPRIFDPFFTTKAPGEGTGLGLAVSHGIITALGAQLDVESELGIGTTLKVRLARAPDELVAARTQKSAIRHSPFHARVLVIDDEPALLHTVEQRLKPQHEVIAVTDADIALKRLVAGERFDLVLCDAAMAQLDGVELLRQLKAVRPDQAKRVVFIAGADVDTQMRMRLMALSAAVLEKPFRGEQIEELLAARSHDQPISLDR